MQYLILKEKEQISTTQDGNSCKCLFFTVNKSFYLEPEVFSVTGNPFKATGQSYQLIT